MTKTAWTIYNPIANVEDLRLFSTKKAATEEYNRIYGKTLRGLVKKYAPDVKIVKVTFEV